MLENARGMVTRVHRHVCLPWFWFAQYIKSGPFVILGVASLMSDILSMKITICFFEFLAIPNSSQQG